MAADDPTLREEQDEVTEAGAEQAPADAPEAQAEAELVEEDLEELEARAAQRDEYLALAQRTQADFENFRKRIARDAENAEARALARTVKELLPALDNLERAIAAAEAEEDDLAPVGEAAGSHHLTKGIRLVQQELVATLGRLGVEAFSPKGEAFDPTEHEAVAQQPVEGADAGTVVEVYQPGYRLNGAVLRPARVVVAA
ncbi:MAG TPA: nucleotide exchange factor GrpE [Solirubrobacteraceae bacterium]|jgi:molecular chaperone GrpE